MSESIRQGEKGITSVDEGLDDTELLSMIADGDRDAFSQLYLKYQPKLVSYCARMLRDDFAQAAGAQNMPQAVQSRQDTLGVLKVNHCYPPPT